MAGPPLSHMVLQQSPRHLPRCPYPSRHASLRPPSACHRRTGQHYVPSRCPQVISQRARGSSRQSPRAECGEGQTRGGQRESRPRSRVPSLSPTPLHLVSPSAPGVGHCCEGPIGPPSAPQSHSHMPCTLILSCLRGLLPTEEGRPPLVHRKKPATRSRPEVWRHPLNRFFWAAKRFQYCLRTQGLLSYFFSLSQ